MYERRHEPLLPASGFLRRVAAHSAVGFSILAVSLLIGVSGYHALEGLSWIDSLLNAAMILGGMGPIAELQTEGGKLFASAYALFSGIVFLGVAGILIAPILHRILHTFHLEDEEEQPLGEP